MGTSAGVPYDRLGFDEQRFRPTVLQRYDEAAVVAEA
jgi:hypothetical protein